MQRYFIHCQWSLDSTSTHVIYLGECGLVEANGKFEAVVKEADEYELITLDDGADHEICRNTKSFFTVENRQPAPTRLHQLRNFFWSRQNT